MIIIMITMIYVMELTFQKGGSKLIMTPINMVRMNGLSFMSK